MSIWVFVFILAAVVAVVAYVKRGPPGPRNYIMKAETGVFSAMDTFLGQAPGTVEKSKPLVIAVAAADSALDKAIPVVEPIAAVIPALQPVLAIAKVADQALDAAEPHT